MKNLPCGDFCLVGNGDAALNIKKAVCIAVVDSVDLARSLHPLGVEFGETLFVLAVTLLHGQMERFPSYQIPPVRYPSLL